MRLLLLLLLQEQEKTPIRTLTDQAAAAAVSAQLAVFPFFLFLPVFAFLGNCLQW